MDWVDVGKTAGGALMGAGTVLGVGWKIAQNYRDRLTAVENTVANQPTSKEYDALKAAIEKGFGDLQIHLGGFQGIGGLIRDCQDMRTELGTVDERILESRHLHRDEVNALLLTLEARLTIRIRTLEETAAEWGAEFAVVKDRLSRMSTPRRNA